MSSAQGCTRRRFLTDSALACGWAASLCTPIAAAAVRQPAGAKHRLDGLFPRYERFDPASHVPVNHGAADDDGVYVTDAVTGRSRMVASYKRIVDEAVPRIDVNRYGAGDFYGFHVKWNAASDRMFLVLRCMPERDRKYRPRLVTMTRTGQDIRLAVPSSEWADKGGNHPNWCPDGEHVFMNLDIDGKGWRFVQARHDGTGLAKMTDIPASQGHPSLHRGGACLITDAYATEAAFGDTTSPLWFIDLAKHEKATLARVENVTPLFAKEPGKAQEMRVDLHPAWDSRTNRLVAFNGVDTGTRRVFVADASAPLRRRRRPAAESAWRLV